jgi:hypothetical protein
MSSKIKEALIQRITKNLIKTERIEGASIFKYDNLLTFSIVNDEKVYGWSNRLNNIVKIYEDTDGMFFTCQWYDPMRCGYETIFEVKYNGVSDTRYIKKQTDVYAHRCTYKSVTFFDKLYKGNNYIFKNFSDLDTFFRNETNEPIDTFNKFIFYRKNGFTYCQVKDNNTIKVFSNTGSGLYKLSIIYESQQENGNTVYFTLLDYKGEYGLESILCVHGVGVSYHEPRDTKDRYNNTVYMYLFKDTVKPFSSIKDSK